MAEQVEEVKQKTDIVSLISEHVELKKAGRNYKALCPFHSEKTPSFIVSPELQIFKCFGCGESGDAIAFLQKYEGMEFYEALRFLADRAGVRLKPLSGAQRSDKERLYQINSLASYFYKFVLLKHKVGREALEYLTKKRGLSLETIKAFELGYSPDAPLGLKRFLIDKKKVSLKDLERVGIVYMRGSEAMDRFRGRIIFPLQDVRGNIVGFSGRVLPTKDRNLAKYINSPETEIYHKSKVLYALNVTRADIKKEKTAVVVEGELDALSSWQVGIKNVVAIKGSSLTEEQIGLLSRFAERLNLALDTDLAGDAASRRAIEVAETQRLDVRVVKLLPFKDPDEAAQKDPEKLKNAIKSAQGVWDFIIDSVFERHVEGEAKIAREIVPLLSRIQDKIVQAHYAGVVAKRLSVPIEAVLAEVEKFQNQDKQKPKIEVLLKVNAKSRRELLEERLLSLSFRCDSKILLKRKLSKLIVTPLSKRLVEELQLFYKKHKSFDPSLFAGELPRELVDGYTDMVLKEAKGLKEETDERLKKELGLVVRELKILDIKSKLETTAKLIRDMEEKGENKKLKQKEEEFGELAKTLNRLEQQDFRGIIL